MKTVFMDMLRTQVLFSLGLLIFAPSCSPGTDEPGSGERPPNIVYILADDLGYGELGCYGQRIIETPNIDALAAGGMRFTQHYSGAPVCAPARCVLMTGMHSGHAHIRGNDEWGSRGAVWDYLAMFNDPRLEGQRPIPDSVVTVAERLQAGGYRTAIIGKWGLGASGTEGVPNRQGFDFFYGYNCQRQAHTYYPLHLWKNGERVMLRNDTVPPRTKLAEGADPDDPASFARFRLTDYAPDLMQQEALGFIEANRESPFFLYYATPLPHLPLQAPERWVDHYREKLGREAPYLGVEGYFPNRCPRASYAAMISYLDEQVGQIMRKLKELGLDENTLIIFSSDNGPTYTGGADTPFFDSGGPFKCEAGWGKGSVHEGGIRVPMIAAWPGRIPAGSSSDHLSAFFDILPTLCDVAGLPTLEYSDGISFAATLRGAGRQVEHEYLYWEFPEYGGQQAVRMGKWKGIRQQMQEGNLEIELYDLEADVGEQHDVAGRQPAVVEQIRAIMEREHVPPAIERFRIAALEGR